MPKRKIVKIDADKCNGCGQCVSACAEGAIAIVSGKARLVKDSYCDGLGACLGECPQDAITIEEREADDFDEAAATAHKHGPAAEPSTAQAQPPHHGCPGTMARTLKTSASPAASTGSGCAGDCPATPRSSMLGQWPIQLALVPSNAPFLRGRELALVADCVGFAFPELHPRVLSGRAVAIACPKLDDAASRGYVEKLAAIFRDSGVSKVTVYRMEVPCCSGLTRIAKQALAESGARLPLEEVTMGISGQVLE